MFKHLELTQFPPKQKPVLVYDGTCGFCKYWVIKWKRKTKPEDIDYLPLQEAAQLFSDIEEYHFKEALRCILPNGKIYSGPAAAYYSYFLQNPNHFLFSWYEKNRLFRALNDFAYQWIADHRDFVFKVCIRVLGKDPRKPNLTRLYGSLTILALLISLIIVAIAKIAFR